MRLKASPLRSGVLSPVTTAPAHREPTEAGGMVLGKYPCLLFRHFILYSNKPNLKAVYVLSFLVHAPIHESTYTH